MNQLIERRIDDGRRHVAAALAPPRHDVIRQGAHDLIKRCEKILTDYENRLHLVEHFQKVKKTVASIHTCAEEIAECDDKSVVREKIAQIAELSSKILEEY